MAVPFRLRLPKTLICSRRLHLNKQMTLPVLQPALDLVAHH